MTLGQVPFSQFSSRWVGRRPELATEVLPELLSVGLGNLPRWPTKNGLGWPQSCSMLGWESWPPQKKTWVGHRVAPRVAVFCRTRSRILTPWWGWSWWRGSIYHANVWVSVCVTKNDHFLHMSRANEHFLKKVSWGPMWVTKVVYFAGKMGTFSKGKVT